MSAVGQERTLLNDKACHVMSRKTQTASAICLAIIVVLYAMYVSWRNDWYRQKMPPEVGIGDVVLIDGKSGFREGCGVAIFELTPAASAQLQAAGIRALNAGDARSPYRPSKDKNSIWHETPYVETGDGLTLEDRWAVGLSCAKLSHELSATITRAMAQPGSFYTKLYEAAVLVIPAAGIAALVFYG